MISLKVEKNGGLSYLSSWNGGDPLLKVSVEPGKVTFLRAVGGGWEEITNLVYTQPFSLQSLRPMLAEVLDPFREGLAEDVRERILKLPVAFRRELLTNLWQVGLNVLCPCS